MDLPCWNRTNYLPDYSRMLYQSELRVVPRDSEGAIGVFAGCKRSGHRGARTPDPGLIRPMLYHLSYATTLDVGHKIRKPGIEPGTSCV